MTHYLNTVNRKLLFVTLVVLALVIVTGCVTKPPKAEREAAEQAYQAAKLAEKCAPITYQSARQALDKARRLVTEKKYDEAKHYFVVAKNLFEQAEKEATENPDCLADADKPEETTGEQTDVGATGTGLPDTQNVESPDYELVMVHFPFNSDELTAETMETLQGHARWMLLHGTASVRIEGHCDDRGSLEYNLSLGERRADAVRRYLVSLGIDPERILVLSYGEERPLIDEQTEDAWTKNRRAEFVKIWNE